MFRTICCLILMTGVAGANEMEFTMENSHIKIVDGKPHKLTITNNSETRADVRIFRRTFINKECKLVGLPIYNILRPAIHGIVCYRDEHSPLRIATGKERCIGVDVMLRVVYFEPNKNYVGGDSFQFTISQPDYLLLGIADVNVTLTKSQLSADPASGSQDEPQKAGRPMPRCTELAM